MKNEPILTDELSEPHLREGVCALCSLWESCQDLERCLIDGKYFFEKFEDKGDD
jgi:hypothetical protein